MRRDIDAALRNWEYRPGTVQARLVEAGEHRQVIQMRLDLGLLQLETTGRPDGAQPHGHATYADYLRHQARLAERTGRPFVLDDEQCREADREFVQFYHRRRCWLVLGTYARAMADADHTLALMDLVRDHSPSEEYTQEHERQRHVVVFDRTQAAAALAVQQNNPEAAIDEIRAGLEQLRHIFAGLHLEDQMEDDSQVRQLRKMERSLRQVHNIDATLREQLEQAVANEQYEVAAKLRDALRRRQ
jgi:hypothetical protein